MPVNKWVQIHEYLATNSFCTCNARFSSVPVTQCTSCEKDKEVETNRPTLASATISLRLSPLWNAIEEKFWFWWFWIGALLRYISRNNISCARNQSLTNVVPLTQFFGSCDRGVCLRYRRAFMWIKHKFRGKSRWSTE